MSNILEPYESLKLRSMRAVVRHHRMASGLFDAQCRNLFLKAGQKSYLKTMRMQSDDRPHLKKTKSRTNTETTLVPITDSDALKSNSGSKIRSNQYSNSCSATWELIEQPEAVHSVLSEHAYLNAFIIPKENSWAHFNVTKEVYEALSTRIDIFPAFRETIMYMGARRTEFEVLPPPPKWRSLEEDHKSAANASRECAYVLRFAQPNGRPGPRSWSLRQFAVYDKYASAAGASKWVFVSPPDDAIAIFQENICQEGVSGLEADVSVHIMFINYAVGCFRAYLTYLSEQVAKNSQLINFADPMGGCKVDLATNGLRLKLKMLEDDIADALLALRGNQQVVDELKRMWCCCGTAIGTTDEEMSIAGSLSETSREIESACLQAQTLRDKLLSCTQIVSSFSELSNGQTLQRLAEAAGKESVRTAVLSLRAQRDAAAVKALSVIALIYLPTGVVLNFFSTSLIDLSQDKVALAAQWWLFLAIGLPLTIITIVAWYLWLLMNKDDLRDRERCSWWSKSCLRKPDQDKV